MKHFILLLSFFCSTMVLAQSKRVSSIDCYNRGYHTTVTFTYDSQDRIISGTRAGSSSNTISMNFTYGDNTITIDAEGSAHRTDILRLIAYLEDGRIVKFEEYVSNKYSDPDVYHVDYDDNGRVIKIQREGITNYFDIKWDNNNISSVSFGNEINTYEYSSYDNPVTNFYFFELFIESQFTEMDLTDPYHYLSYLLGNRPQKLLSKVNSQEGSYYDCDNYTYEFDSEGNILKVTSTDSEDSSNTNIAIFNYENTTGINDIQQLTSPAVNMYNLSGQKVNMSEKGLVIINDGIRNTKKVFVK